MSTTTPTERVVLTHVPKIHFYEGGPRCPEDFCFPSAMRAVLEYLGENLGCQHCQVKGKDWGLKCSYAYFVGVSGSGFLMSWKPGWQEDSFVMDYLPGDLLEPYRWSFKAIGYGSEIVGPEQGEPVLRQKIIESIRDRGKPVIGFGIAGPPEAAIITGYDEGGDVLLGWSFFQKEPFVAQDLEFEGGSPNNYFRKRSWFQETHRLIIIGEKGEPPNQGQLFIESLKYALEVMRTEKVERASGPAFTGPAGYSAWAQHLLRAEDFPADDEETLRQHYRAHDFMVGNVAEARWYAAQWLINTFERAHHNLAEELLKAAGCLAGEHELMWRAWDLCGGIGSPDGWQQFSDPLVRAQLAALVEESRAKYLQAARHIENALAKV